IDYSAAKSAAVSDVAGETDTERYLDNIAVYPNPTTGMLHIDAVDVQKVECYSQMGQLVGVYDNVNELNIGELAKGVYMLRITVPQGVTMRKVVKR
ncbi:MAG: T9SS type A sorting domain-containing protein, partial [Bacteroidales bacterium]|nr:T9SS type A sorting domain-containing protein [Bacteroidales bacterium]